MELKANETDKLINAMSLKPTDDAIKYDWNTEARECFQARKRVAGGW